VYVWVQTVDFGCKCRTEDCERQSRFGSQMYKCYKNPKW